MGLVNILLGGTNKVFLYQIELIQRLLPIMYINLNYPLNLRVVLQMFTTGFFQFLPNPFLWFFKKENLVDNAPEAYFRNELYGILFKDLGSYWFMDLIFLTLNITLKLFAAKADSVLYLQAKNQLGKGFMFRFFVVTLPCQIIALGLQIVSIPSSKAFYVLSWVFSLLLAIFIIFQTLRVNNVYRKFNGTNFVTATKLIEQYGYIFTGFIDELTNKPNGFIITIIIRMIFVIPIFLALSGIPFLQGIFLALQQILFTILIVNKKPYYDERDQKFRKIFEGLLIAIYIFPCCFIYKYEENPPEDVIFKALGWVLIVLCIGIIVYVKKIVLMDFWWRLKEIKEKYQKNQKEKEQKEEKENKKKKLEEKKLTEESLDEEYDPSKLPKKKPKFDAKNSKKQIVKPALRVAKRNIPTKERVYILKYPDKLYPTKKPQPRNNSHNSPIN